jgi:hypothetical protein
MTHILTKVKTAFFQYNVQLYIKVLLDNCTFDILNTALNIRLK